MLLCLVHLGLLMIGTACQGVTPEVETEPRLPAYATELYAYGDLRGRITLSVREQVLDFWLHDPGATYTAEFPLQAAGADFTVAAFTSLGPDTLLLGGYREAEADDGEPVAELAVLRFEPRGKSVRVEALKWRGPRPAAVTSLDLFPSGRRVALLDTVSNRVLVLDLETRIMREVADSTRAPELRLMKFVHVWPSRGSDLQEEALEILVTSVPEAAMGTGRLVGPMVRIMDLDGDGVFEHVR